MSEELAPPRLCYVSGNFAYFTTQELSKQWADDWDDAPFEHNSGPPYEYGEHDKKAGKKPWKITKCAWEGPFHDPSYGHCNSPYSVEDINAGAVPWLSTDFWTPTRVYIQAGTPFHDFCSAIKLGGGRVYVELE